MKKFSARVTQFLHGFYEGTIEIEANSKKDAKKIFEEMTNDEIDNCVDWQHGDEYWGDIDSIKLETDFEEN